MVVVRYGAALNTERGSEGITMGVTAAMYAWGMEYEDPISLMTLMASLMLLML